VVPQKRQQHTIPHHRRRRRRRRCARLAAILRRPAAAASARTARVRGRRGRDAAAELGDQRAQQDAEDGLQLLIVRLLGSFRCLGVPGRLAGTGAGEKVARPCALLCVGVRRVRAYVLCMACQATMSAAQKRAAGFALVRPGCPGSTRAGAPTHEHGCAPAC
jgi:hypothetical protein